jgi:acyl-CoA hydrolase
VNGKPVRESMSEYSEVAMPNDANPLGTLFGGKVMHLVDLAGSIAAFRHARTPVITASVDYMTFLCPVRIGQLLVLRSMVNRVFRTSMEVGVRVCVEDLMTGDIRHTSSAYLTFVAAGSERETGADHAGIPRKRRGEPAVGRCGATPRVPARSETQSCREGKRLAFRFVHVLDVRLVDQQVRRAVAVELEAALVVPLDDAVKFLTVLENDDHRRLALHLLYVIKVLGVGLFGGYRFLLQRGRLLRWSACLLGFRFAEGSDESSIRGFHGRRSWNPRG